MESERIKIISLQLETIYSGLRSIIYYRVLAEHVSVGQSFWISTKVTHLGSFALCWSKLFGAHREDLHWKKSNGKPFLNAFRKYLVSSLGTDRYKYRKYLKEILDLRNKYFAHTDISNDIVRVPELDDAIESMIILHDVLKNIVINENGNLYVYKGPACLKQWVSNLQKEAQAIISSAVMATIGLAEYQ